MLNGIIGTLKAGTIIGTIKANKSNEKSHINFVFLLKIVKSFGSVLNIA